MNGSRSCSRPISESSDRQNNKDRKALAFRKLLIAHIDSCVNILRVVVFTTVRCFSFPMEDKAKSPRHWCNLSVKDITPMPQAFCLYSAVNPTSAHKSATRYRIHQGSPCSLRFWRFAVLKRDLFDSYAERRKEMPTMKYPPEFSLPCGS